MKRGILLVLIGLLLVTSMVGCNTYRRSVVTAPDTTVGDGVRGERGFHYRQDGQVIDGRTTNHRYNHSYRNDGRVTDSDGIIGNGTHADGNYNVRRGLDRMVDQGIPRSADGTRAVNPGTDAAIPPMGGVTPGIYRNDLVAR